MVPFKELPKDAYQALEDIVDSENISQDPAILDSYAFSLNGELVSRDGSKFMPRPAAAILPGSTEEVQAIVRVCNRYKIKFKAFSAGWAFVGIAAPFEEGMLQIDLRRMDKILEIDEKNMFAVVEPYVIGTTLQAEAMKLGLNTHLIGAGSNCSPLASACAGAGPGGDTIFMGYSPQNLLALEWVMPTGEILRTGALGSGCGWFCGEGPGPSTRGAFRGMQGSSGGLGVFTKCALKLYPWPGPAVMPVEGTVPAYNSPLPDNFSAYTVAFPGWDAYFEANYKLFNAEIAYNAYKQYILFGEELQAAMVRILTDPTKQLDDLEELLKKPEIQKLTEKMRRSFQIILAGMTPRDKEYKEKALDEILASTGGHKVPELSEPLMRNWTLLYLMRLCFKNINYVWGGYIGGFVHGGTPDFAKSWYPLAIELKRKFLKEKRGLVDGGADTLVCALGSIGGGGGASAEQFTQYDPTDPESVKVALEFLASSRKVGREHKLGGGLLDWHPLYKEKMQQVLSAASRPAIFHWQGKIKRAFDPNDLGDTSWPYLEESKK